MAGNILGALLLEIVTKANTSGLDKTDRSLKRTGKTLKNIHKEAGFLSKMTNKLMGGFSIYGVKNMFDSYLQFEKDLGSMRSRFYAITLDENKANEEFEFIRKQATDLALDIKSTADSYSIFYSATRKALGEEGTRGVFENWTKVGRVLHLSEYQMERVTYALREMASKGAIYSQDLRMQIGTHVPNAMGLAQKAAEEMGFTGNDWFEKLQKSAKGNAKLTAEFVKRFSKQAELAYASPEALKKAMQQPDALAKTISNIGYNFMVDFSKAGGSYMIIKILQGVSKALLSIPYDKITTALGNIAHAVGNFAQYIPEIGRLLLKIVGYVAILRIFKGISIAYNAFKGIWLFFKGGSLAWKGLGVLLKLGPIGTTIAETLLKFTGKTALKGALSGILSATGPLGWIVTALMWLPEIAKLIKWIWSKTPWGKTGIDTNSSAIFAGMTAKQIRDKANAILTDPRLNPLNVEHLALEKGFTKEQAKQIYYDSGNIYITLDGTGKNTEEITDSLLQKLEETRNKKINKNTNGLFNRPEGIDKKKFRTGYGI